MRVLSRYFAARFLGLFAASLCAAVLAVSIVEVLLNFDDLVKVQDTGSGSLTYFRLLILSRYLPLLVPVAAFVASFLCFGLAAHWLEITATKAGGISPQRAALPVLLAACLLACAGFAVNETWSLQATREWRQRDTGEIPELDYRRGSFWYQRGRTIYNLSGADREAQTLQKVRVFERDARGRLQRSIQAPQVRVEPGHRWRFEAATIRHFDPQRAGAPPRVETWDEITFQIWGGSEAALMGADAALLPLPQLQRHLAAHSPAGPEALRLSVVLHTRQSAPLILFALVLLAVPLGLRAEAARGLGRPAAIGIASLAALLLSRTLAEMLAEQGVTQPAVAIWGVAGAFTAWGAWRFARIPR